MLLLKMMVLGTIFWQKKNNTSSKRINHILSQNTCIIQIYSYCSTTFSFLMLSNFYVFRLLIFHYIFTLFSVILMILLGSNLGNVLPDSCCCIFKVGLVRFNHCKCGTCIKITFAFPGRGIQLRLSHSCSFSVIILC